jgi:hypothetical protein
MGGRVFPAEASAGKEESQKNDSISKRCQKILALHDLFRQSPAKK